MRGEITRIIREIDGLKPFWRKRFRGFLAGIASADGREVTDEDIRGWLEENPNLCLLTENLVRAVPESWKRRE